MEGDSQRKNGPLRQFLRSWGPCLSLYVLVIGAASIGIPITATDIPWWLPSLLGFVIMPVVVVAGVVAIEVLYRAWEKL